MVRGPQTPGELRSRAERLHHFDDLESVENTLAKLSEMGFTARLARQPGFKEARYAHLLCGPVEAGVAEPEQGTERKASDRDRIATLENAVEELKREFEEFRKRFE